jgi:hypothetical protein
MNLLPWPVHAVCKDRLEVPDNGTNSTYLMKTLFATVTVCLCISAAAQQSQKKSVVIGSMTTRPDAVLIVNPPGGDQGVLLPQLSTGQRISLKPNSPSEDGLIVFDTNFQSYYYWSDGAWTRMYARGKNDSYCSIDPSGFQHLASSGNVRHNNLAVFETDNTFVTATADALGEQIMAPVNLPNGSIMKELTLYYLDNDTDNLKVTLLRKGFAGSNEVILTWESSQNTGSIQTQTLSDFTGKGTIDNENYSYRLMVEFDIDPEDVITKPEDARQRIYGVRIKYQQ